MTKIILHGANGKMGQAVASIAASDSDVEIIAGIDAYGANNYPFPVYPGFAACDAAADAVIDFSVAGAVGDLLDYCEKKRLPLVLCTTGLSEEQEAQIERVAGSIAILKSANMSLGINLLMKLLAEVAPTLASAGFDIEIIEKHHNQKVDAPSGTALALANIANESLDNSCNLVFDRSNARKARSDKEIGVSSVRGGTIVGEHDILFAGTDETVTFSHAAYSKAIFAKGAVAAAKFIAGKPAGRYTMADVIG